ncbi:MAG TPA: hypothetical protein PK559_10855 [Ignavibacteriaceae bacterium]|nr:hypothetical protein [Ignavibacteriaceae bacterium]
MTTIKIKRRVNSTLLRIKELDKFKGKRVELNLSIKEVNENSKNIENNLAGVFSKYVLMKEISIEKDAWELAVRDKHENYRR